MKSLSHHYMYFRITTYSSSYNSGNTNKCTIIQTHVFFLLLSSYTFQRNRHLQVAYTKISLERTAINSFTIHVHVNSAGTQHVTDFGFA